MVAILNSIVLQKMFTSVEMILAVWYERYFIKAQQEKDLKYVDLHKTWTLTLA